ncbi:hypothetical protein BDR26DRAFT_832361 [Obelidium mucronatum]|nr:hypothetical protein BDR26DRAFT_832361 [Obelidium mucronatum]
MDRRLYARLHSLHKALLADGAAEVALHPLPRALLDPLDALLDAALARSAAAAQTPDLFSAPSSAAPTPASAAAATPAAALPAGPEYHPNRRGAPCGHVFEDGEGVFWCRNCALDETCVLCHHCFHASDHEGHDTTFHISSGGGCCDCGDPQAWRLSLQCKFHSTDEATIDSDNVIPVPDDVINDIRTTISTVLDFIIDTFNSSPSDLTLPTRQEQVLAANPPEPGDEDCGTMLETATADGGMVSIKRDMFACILWNDEDHTFDEVILKVKAGINCSDEKASAVAVNVDSVGREVIGTSYQLGRLLATARTINENRPNGLSVSIRTVRDTFRENLAAYLVDWIRDLSSRVRGQARGKDGVSTHASVVLAVRNIICQELCSPRRKVKDMLIAEFLAARGSSGSSSSGDSDMKDVADGDGDVDMRDSSPFGAALASSEKTRWRLDYLIGLESRLWKSLRVALKGLYIESLIISGEEYKRAMALRFTYTYPIIANSYLIQDREYLLSMMNFTVQLFTVPSIAEHLITNTSVVHCLFSTLKAFFLSDHYEVIFPYSSLLKSIRRANRLIRPTYTKLTFELHGDRVYQKQKYSHIFSDMKFFFAAPPIRMNLFRNGDLSEFAGFLDLCRVMQGMYPQKRHIRTHIEYESQAWTNSFYLGANLSRVLEHIGDAFAPTSRRLLKQDLQALIRAIKLTLKVLDDWCAQEQLQEFQEWDAAVNERMLSAHRAGHTFIPPIRSLDGFIPISFCQLTPSQRVLDFKSLGRVLSLHCPLHWVLGKLLACLPQYGVELGVGAFSLKDIMTIDDVVEPKPKDLSDLSFVEDLDDWSTFDDSTDTVTLPHPQPVPVLLQQISQEDHIARIMDHPLRSEVFLSQIRSGLWVRNGMSMRSQLLYFKFILLREMYDLDVFLMQSFAVMVGPDRFIATLVDRYDIRAWFEGNVLESSKKFFNDTQPSIGLAEDLLNLLVNILIERTRIGVVGVQEQAKKEMIHVLATSPNGLPYSKISEAIPYEITRLLQGLPTTSGSAATPTPTATAVPGEEEEEYFFQPCDNIETILGQVAVYKPPTMSNDKGMYELRDEYYDSVDPWFHHYTRTQREEVDATLCKRIAQKNGPAATMPKLLDAAKTGSLNQQVAVENSWVQVNLVAKRHGLYLPKISPVLEESGFSAIDDFVCGKSFVVLLLMGLNNLVRTDAAQACKSDHAMASIVQLLLVSLEIELSKAVPSKIGERFVDQAGVLYSFECLGSNGPVSLVGKVLEVLDRAGEDAFKDHVERLSLFVIRLNSFGPSSALDQVVAWQNKHNLERAAAEAAVSVLPGAEGAAAGLSDKERRKEESKRRQAAIMAKFAQQQQSFLSTNVDGDSEIEDVDEDMDAVDVPRHSAESSFLAESRPWSCPAGSCIMCQEDFSRDNRLYGMLAFSQPSYIQRSRFVDFRDPHSVLSAITTPSLTDANEVQSTTVYVADPNSGSLYQRFPRSLEVYPTGESRDMEIYTSSCGHLMHSSCFEQYFNSIEARQNMESRLYAESTDRGEFLCPLCKSLGNIMLPIRPSAVKTEVVNWAGSNSSETDPSVGLVPVGKGGEKNALEGLQMWFDGLKPRLQEALEKRSKMQMYDAEAMEEGEDGSSKGNAGSSSGGVGRATAGAQRRQSTSGNQEAGLPTPVVAAVPPPPPAARTPILNQFLNMLGQMGQENLANQLRRASDASASTDEGEPRGDQAELQELIDRLMTPLIRMTDDCLTNGLLNSLEYTISSLERSIRGNAVKNREETADSSPSLVSVHVLEQLNSGTLVFLRVLSEAILQLNEFQSSAEDFDKGAYPDANTDLLIFFNGMDQEVYPRSANFTPQLEFAGFSTLMGITFANEDPVVLDDSNDIFRWVGLTWASEVLRTMVSVIKSVTIHGDSWYKNDAIIKASKGVAFGSKKAGMDVKGKTPVGRESEMMDVEFDLTPEDQEHAFQMGQFMMFIMSRMNLTEEVAKAVLSSVSPAVMFSLVRSMTLPFLRSSAIYLYTRFFLVPPAGSAGFGHRIPSGLIAREEYEQLRVYLQLPSLWTLCSTWSVSDPFLSKLFGNWVEATNGRESHRRASLQDSLQKIASGSDDTDTYRLERSITLESPAVVTLVGLPNGLENLFADCFRRTCNNCQKPISDPALCLVCGTLVCALSFCCHKDKKGECNNHMKQCSGDVGVFFLVKRFKILLLHNEKGCIMDPPYLDIHGEVDVNRRKGSRQFLHLKRYDEIRKLWLSHNLPSYVARAVESVHSYGGWTQY